MHTYTRGMMVGPRVRLCEPVRWDLAEAIYMQVSAYALGYTVRHT